ncbi:hypothetical protein D3C86_1902610 [compost metagenome]
MPGGELAEITKECQSTVRNETSVSLGWETEQRALMAKVFYSTTKLYMPNGWMILKTHKPLMAEFQMWHQLFGVITAIM